ncbi:MAG: inositol monophosphatase [Candidatus Cloacimonetes bacterium]|nr:inositol monophosphatase [Candidatus Cloacimonadota bacterium]
MKSYLDIAIEAARKGSEIIKENFHKKKEIDYKGRINLVTNVDKEAEAVVIETISKYYPKHNILTEETKHKQDNNQSYRWVIDPLDGTTNYVHGFPFVCVSIALQKDDESILGVVYNPILDELFYAEKGKGSFRNDQTISVSYNADFSKSLLATGFPYDMYNEERNNIRYFSKMIKQCRGIRRPGAAALDMCYVACGIFDGYWELELFPWDTAAGLIIVEEAGGKVTTFDGLQFSIFDKEIVASNGKVHKEMLKGISLSS